MEVDDPDKPEFATWRSYIEFARSVRHTRRFVWTARETAFLETVRATNRDRDVDLRKGMILYRAQLGTDLEIRTDDDGMPLYEESVGYCAARMKPRLNQAKEGRANPAGIPVLYLGTTEKTAISEVRPWKGTSVSVAQFEILRPLRAIDLSRGHGKSSLGEIGLDRFFGGDPVESVIKERAVWIDIDSAFSEPVTGSDDLADYVPTQILAELFRDVGYDAVIYKSQFDEAGFNVVIFEPDCADPINCAPYEVTEIEVKFKEEGNRWYRQTS
jgi:hypothetical protein